MGIFSFVIDDSLPENQKHTQLHIDESLFEQIGNNDKEAFEILYHLTERTMYPAFRRQYLPFKCKNQDHPLIGWFALAL
ncbi:MAG: hypothetical protein KGZ96_14390 [Clostridia bacterium]|nr:hypothetical protein [Clostridia bacterium]